jgi:hypothetical protein
MDTLFTCGSKIKSKTINILSWLWEKKKKPQPTLIKYYCHMGQQSKSKCGTDLLLTPPKREERGKWPWVD